MPFQTLRDGSKKLSRALGVPVFVAVDRAGWVRDVESLPTADSDPQSFALRFLLERPAYEAALAELGAGSAVLPEASLPTGVYLRTHAGPPRRVPPWHT